MLEKAEATREKILETAEGLIFEKGFSGTSLRDIVGGANLTKGAFFHHFDDKAALVRAVVERWANIDQELFEGFAERAAALADNPLQEVLLFLKLFEEWADDQDEQLPGCMFASYVYERQQLDPKTRAFISEGLNEWIALFEEKFDKLLATRCPKIATVTARELAELAAALVEGGFILSRVFGDQRHLMGQLQQLRNYLNLLFED